MTYPLVTLGDIVDIKGGKRLSKGDSFLSEPTNHPYIRAQDIRAGKVNSNDLVYISDAQHASIKNYITNEGDVCITIVGANVGDVGIVPKELDKANLTENAVKLVNPKNCDRKFVMYCLLTYNAQAQMKLLAGGAAQPKLGIYKVAQIEIPLPPLPTQRRIADILSAYDDLIENNTRRIRILEGMAQAIYHEWFGRVDKESLPEGWEATKIANAFEILGGSTPSTKIPEYWEGGDINWYSPSDLTANKAMFIRSSSKKITQEGLKNSSAKMFPPYCVMMTSRATIGVVSINTTTACTNQGFITCIPNERVSLYQIYFWILDNFELIDNVASGATYKEIGRGEFREFDFVLPDKETKNKFDEIMSPIGKQIEILLAKNANLRQTRDLLLPRLVSGEIAV
jgi:type I restriction enzyme S subunit